MLFLSKLVGIYNFYISTIYRKLCSVIFLWTALRLVKVRAEAMQLASEVYEGAMVRVIFGPDSKLGLACARAKEWCLQTGVENPQCKVAAYLYPHSKIVAGNKEVRGVFLP